jgi:hypothetical protein
MLNYFDSVGDIIISLLIWLIGGVILHAVGKRIGTSPLRSLTIYVYHSIFCVIFTAFSRTGNLDTATYYEQTRDGDVSFSLGEGAITLIGYLPVQIFDLSFLGTNLLFAILSCIGVILMDRVLNDLATGKGQFVEGGALVFVFIPSLHYWTAAIGKDNLFILATGLILWFALNPTRRVPLLIAAVLLMTLARPHMAILFLGALILAGLVSGGVSRRVKLIVVAAGAVAFSLLLPVTLAHFGVGQGIGDILEFLKSRQDIDEVRRGQSFIDPDMTFPMRVVTFMFRPLPFEATTFQQWVVAIENLVLLGAMIVLVTKVQIRFAAESDLPGQSLIVIYAVLGWLLMAYVTYNLGLASRQKWMVLPFVMVALVAIAKRPASRELTI